MRIHYVSSDDEFIYAKFPTARSVELWVETYVKTKPLRCIGGNNSWHVEWLMVQRFSPEPVIEPEPPAQEEKEKDVGQASN